MILDDLPHEALYTKYDIRKPSSAARLFAPGRELTETLFWRLVEALSLDGNEQVGKSYRTSPKLV